MIIDRIEEQERYYALHKDMELAFAFLAEAPDLEPGRYELENGLFATVSEGDTRPLDTVNLEAHRNYIDLQYCIAGGEHMAWAHVQELNLVEQDPEHDNYFYTGKSTTVSIRPGMFYIMFPSDGHKAAVVGDTIGDPFKDTSGPSLNILVKLMSMVSIVMAGLTVAFSLL